MEVGCADGGCGAFAIAHGGPCLVGGMVFQVAHVDVVTVEELLTGRIDEGGETETMSELMKQDSNEVDVAARIAVETVIPICAGKAIVIVINTAIECSDDFSCTAIEIGSG